MLHLLAVLLVCAVQGTTALDNGLILTPPMAWNTWERFRCNVDCKNDPENCISEKLIKTMAQIMVKEGYKDVGYNWVHIDDCWLAQTRDSQMRLQPDPDRFPSGMKALADYIHSLGLLFGIYEDFGLNTCEGYPGSEYYMQLDAETFADWGVDFLKFDACRSLPSQYSKEFPPMVDWLNRTGRPIGISCAYPKLSNPTELKVDFYERVSQACNFARNFKDIADSWESLASILDFYSKDIGNFSGQARPGYFNDPDELIVGNFGLSYDQQRVNMGMWGIMASPLIMSVDLRTIKPESKALLQHKEIIAINQDKLAIQGRMILQIGNVQVWMRPLKPKGTYAFAFVNFGTDGTPTTVSLDIAKMGLTSASGYNITEVFDNMRVGVFKPGQKLTVNVNPTGIYMGKAVPL